MEKIKLCGIDPSTRTGIAVFETCGFSELFLRHTAREITSRKKGFRRSIEVADRVSQVLDEFIPKYVFIEGYVSTSYGTNINATEIAVLIRANLVSKGIPYLEVAPTTLKKYTSGTGKATKEQMIQAVSDHCQVTTRSDNIADSVGLAYFGGGYFGKVAMNSKQSKMMEAYRKKYMFC